jgi:hypothetical protein
LTIVGLIIDRNQPLVARRVDDWFAHTGKPGKKFSRLLVVSGPPPMYWKLSD